MRPQEIDYSSKRKYYFDTSNGEVLEGQEQVKEYLTGTGNADSIYALGTLLRNSDVPLRPEGYEPLDTKGWPREKYQEYGRWVTRIVAPPTNSQEKKLNNKVLANARRLGIGPSVRTLIVEFNGKSNFYRESQISSTFRTGLFDDWTIDKFVAYVRQVRLEMGIRPKREDLDKQARNSANRPSYNIIYERSREIGGLRKLLELGGGFVAESLDDEGYVNWGTRFMRANDGQLPSNQAINFLSINKLGPSRKPIKQKFGSLPDYQYEVSKRYWEEQSELGRRHELIEQDIQSNRIPLSLFIFSESSDEQEESIRSDELMKALESNLPIMEVIEKYISRNETMARTGKYKVVDKLFPLWSQKDKVKISTEGFEERDFVSSIRKKDHGLKKDNIGMVITAGQIESTALSLHVFDDIWPIDNYLEDLKLGEKYEIYCEKIRQKRRTKRQQSRVLV
jgi:hypothetical protein